MNSSKPLTPEQIWGVPEEQLPKIQTQGSNSLPDNYCPFEQQLCPYWIEYECQRGLNCVVEDVSI